jgi:LDH2 family malate/lactate/ureidoglycolate dehydrogenase
VNEIRIPGERAAASRRRQRQSGIELLETTWKTVSKLAEEFGAEIPKYQEIT